MGMALPGLFPGHPRPDPEGKDFGLIVPLDPQNKENTRFVISANAHDNK